MVPTLGPLESWGYAGWSKWPEVCGVGWQVASDAGEAQDPGCSVPYFGVLKKGILLLWGTILGFRVQGTLFWGPYNREHGKPLLIKATCVIQEQAYPVEVDKGALSAFRTRAVNRACLGVI